MPFGLMRAIMDTGNRVSNVRLTTGKTRERGLRTKGVRQVLNNKEAGIWPSGSAAAAAWDAHMACRSRI